MQGEWARRQGQDPHAGGGGVGCRSKGIGRSISTTHGIVDGRANNCVNASASASTNTVKNSSTSSAIFEQDDDCIHSARAKASITTMIAKAKRRPAAPRAATAPTSPASLLLWGGRHAWTPATATATRTKTKSKGQRRDDDR